MFMNLISFFGSINAETLDHNKYITLMEKIYNFLRLLLLC